MEILEEKIEKWLRTDNLNKYGDGYGSGNGNGSGYGSGNGYGDGSGDGSGDGYGSGSDYGDGSGDGYGSGFGSGFGSGYSYGSGDGSGDGYGYGYSDGSGDGSGDGYGLKSINNKKIYIIDEVPTIIEHLQKNVAKGKIVNKDLSVENCYVVKGQNKFAHGKTLKEAMKSLEEKIFDDMDIDVKIEEFRKKFKKDSRYKGTTLFEWHHKLTGSCLMGRENFVKNNEIDLNKMYTIKEFIELTENDFGGEIIKKLKEFYY